MNKAEILKAALPLLLQMAAKFWHLPADHREKILNRHPTVTEAELIAHMTVNMVREAERQAGIKADTAGPGVLFSKDQVLQELLTYLDRFPVDCKIDSERQRVVEVFAALYRHFAPLPSVTHIG